MVIGLRYFFQHLADIMSRVALLHGDQALLDEYNDRVAEKLNAKTCAQKVNPSDITVEQIRLFLKSKRVPKNKLSEYWMQAN